MPGAREEAAPAPGAAGVALDERDRATLERLVTELRELHGEALVAVLLTGDAATPGYRPRETPLAVAVLLDEVTPEALRRMRGRVRAWRRRRVETPLVLDPAYVRSALDVFPLEFLDLAQAHVLLFGERDPFADLPIDAAHLRLEVEEQLRGKLLHLWEGYLGSAGSRRALRALLAEIPGAFAMVLRGLLYLRRARDEAARAAMPRGSAEIFAAVEQDFGLALPALRRLEAAREGREPLPARERELESVFEDVLAEVRRLVRASDAL